MKTNHMVILGAGESGVGAAILARKAGYHVFVSDGGKIADAYLRELNEHDIPFEEGGHDADRVMQAQEVLKSPGIPHRHPMVQQVIAAGIPILSDIELAYRFKGNSRIIGITGSNGKTTTTALTYHILRHGGMDCALVGNIGISFARQVALDPKPVYVAEISSFQLDDIHTFRPDVAILTNITEDHLDRYDNIFEHYIRAKFRIVENQHGNDYFIYCQDDPVTMAYIDSYHIQSKQLPFTMKKELPIGAYISDYQMKVNGQDPLTMGVSDFAIQGRHNQYNTMAAALAASVMGIRSEKIRESVVTFENLEHRMEKVLTIRGIEFINDSKATNVNSTWYALESMSRPVVLILGGIDKGNDYGIIRELVKEKVKAIVCMGKDNTKIRQALKDVVPVMVETDNAVDAVTASYRLAQKGDVVLLSPACASFDLFRNYEDRGLQFKQAVKEL